MNKSEPIEIVEENRDASVFCKYFVGRVVYTDVYFRQPDSSEKQYAFSYAGEALGNLGPWGESRFQRELMDAHIKKTTLCESGGLWITEYCGNSSQISPDELLDLAEEKGWTVSNTCSVIQKVEVKGAKRWIFHGNFNEYSKAFRFQIFSPGVARDLLNRVSRLRKYGLNLPSEEMSLAS